MRTTKEARLLDAISGRHGDRRFGARLLAHGGERDAARTARVHYDPTCGRLLVTAGATFWVAVAIAPQNTVAFAREIASRLARSGQFIHVPFGHARPALRAGFPDLFPAATSC